MEGGDCIFIPLAPPLFKLLDEIELTKFSTTNEVSGTGYTAGGLTLTPSVGSDSTNNVAYVTFSNVTWSPAGFTCRGALVYNSTTGAACFVLNFGSDKTCNSSFTVQFPSATYSSAILTIGTTSSSINYSSPD